MQTVRCRLPRTWSRAGGEMMADVSRADAAEGRLGSAQRWEEHLLDAELGSKSPVSPAVVRGSAALKGNLDGRC